MCIDIFSVIRENVSQKNEINTQDRRQKKHVHTYIYTYTQRQHRKYIFNGFVGEME